MKSITIRLPDVEAAMLSVLIRRDKRYRDIQGVFLEKLRADFFVSKS